MSDTLRLLLLEDSSEDAELNMHMLRKAGIVFTALRVDTQEAFVAALDDFKPDIILADYRLPGFDGLRALALAREKSPDTPYIFVSGVIGEEFAVESIKRGATDYVLKDRLTRLPVVVQHALKEAKLRTQRREAEERLRTLIDAIPDAVQFKDRDGRWLVFNGTAQRAFGLEQVECQGKSDAELAELAPPPFRASLLRCRQSDEAAWQAGELSRVEEVVALPDGATSTFDVIKVPLFEADGVHKGLVVVGRDITVARRAETELRLLSEAVRQCSEAIILVDDDLNFQYVNPAFERLLGYTLDEVRGRSLSLLVPDDPQLRGSNDLIQDGPFSGERLRLAKDGRRIPVLLNIAPIRQTDGQRIGLVGTMTDLTEVKRSEAELRIAATAFESQEGMLISDSWGVILRVNRAFTDITGYTAEDVVGRRTSMLKSGRHDAAFYAAMWASIHRDGSWQGEIWDRRKNGEVYPEWLTITAVNGAGGEVTHYVATLTDITLRKAAEDEIKHLAFYDPLTRLPNRRLLLDRLQQALASSARSGREGALLFIDLDNFKTLNDTLGHDIGDLLLQQVAQRLATCVREGDTVARLGGDEFVIMLEDLSANLQEAATQTETVGEKVLATLNRPYLLSSYQHHSTPSIGITLFGDQRETVEELLKRADLAMYQAKAAGRNTLRFFDPEMQAVVTTRAALEIDLRQGLQRDEFLLYYQAQVDEWGRMTGAEALVRWRHPRLGLIAPADFIPLAEETGLILPLGHWVLETACTRLVDWAARPGMAHLTLAVNVSARQFHHQDFVDQVLAVIDKTGADPRRLKLELTESLLLDDVEDIIAKMAALKACGVGFSLDDFGTGYSSLSYLKRLPLDQLKIDQSFVRDILTDSNDAAIARTIVALAHSMGLGVIAEGVETEEQREFLARQSCHAFQGYLFGRPQPAEEFVLSMQAASEVAK